MNKITSQNPFKGTPEPPKEYYSVLTKDLVEKIRHQCTKRIVNPYLEKFP